MMVVLPAGTSTTATGRPIATTRLASAVRNSPNGKCRRTHDWRGKAARTSARLE